MRHQLMSMNALDSWFRQRGANVSGRNEAHRLIGLNNTIGTGDVLSVYSSTFGFVDVKHFLAAASKVIVQREQAGADIMAQVHGRIDSLMSGTVTMLLGEGVEAAQFVGGMIPTRWLGAADGLWGSSELGLLKVFKKSEDTVGNLLGVVFATFYYKPDGPSVEEQISAFFQALEVQDPRRVPASAFDPHWKMRANTLIQEIKRLLSQKEPIKH